MAWIFSLSVECGSREAAAAVARFLDGKTVGGAKVSARADGEWVLAVPMDVDAADNSAEAKSHRRALASALVEALVHAPPFRFAFTGVEVDRAREWDELPGESFADPVWGPVVLSDDAWVQAGEPAGFEVFRAGYRALFPA